LLLFILYYVFFRDPFKPEAWEHHQTDVSQSSSVHHNAQSQSSKWGIDSGQGKAFGLANVLKTGTSNWKIFWLTPNWPTSRSSTLASVTSRKSMCVTLEYLAPDIRWFLASCHWWWNLRWWASRWEFFRVWQSNTLRRFMLSHNQTVS